MRGFLLFFFASLVFAGCAKKQEDKVVDPSIPEVPSLELSNYAVLGDAHTKAMDAALNIEVDNLPDSYEECINQITDFVAEQLSTFCHDYFKKALREMLEDFKYLQILNTLRKCGLNHK